MSVKNVEKIITALRAVNGKVHDENFPLAPKWKLKFVGIYECPERGELVVPVFWFDRFAINPIELNFQGIPFITKERVGNIVSSKGLEVFDVPSIEDRIKLIVEL